MSRTVLFVPGFQENESSRDYNSLLDIFRDAGFSVEFVPINWRRSTQDDWVSQLEEVYQRHQPKDVVLAGFSFGAVTALMAAGRRCPSELWLFSLSPLFAEDIDHIKPWEQKELGRHRIDVAGKTIFNLLAKKVVCPVKLFAGSTELSRWPEMRFRFDEARKYFPDIESISVNGVGHHPEAREYRKAIKGSISENPA